MTKKEKAEAAARSKKEEILKSLVSSLQGRYGKESVNYLGNEEIEPLKRIPSQCIAIDEVTGGGYPLGRIIELFGGESSGKTTACYHAIASAQEMFPDKVCGFVDSEYSFDPVYAKAVGVKVEELIVAQPDSGEDGFAILQGMIESGKISLIVVDSVAAMVPRAEAEEDDYGKSTVGLQARMMSKAMRKLVSVIGRHGVVVLFTNQTRESIGMGGYGGSSDSSTPGGKALRFYASIRLKLSKLGAVEEGSGDNKQKVSVKTRVEAVKNKTAPPFRRAEYFVTFGKGIDNDALYFQTILEKFCEKSGGWFTVEGKRIQGALKVKEFFEQNPDVFAKYKQMVDDSYKSKKPEEIPVEERETEEENPEEESGDLS